MKSKFFFPTLLILFLCASCAKPVGKTGASFKLKISALTELGAAGNGGAMLWGRSDKGDMFGTVIQSSAPMQIELNNGTWSFWSVAWEGQSGTLGIAFTGKQRCAKSSAALSGVDVQININLSNATCADTDFSPSVSTALGYNQFPDISHYECNKLTDFNGVGCGKNPSSGKASSRRLLMPSFKKSKDGPFVLEGETLISACREAGASFVSEHLPVGNGNIPAFTVLQSFFSTATCDESDNKGFIKDNYEFGLMEANRLSSVAFVNEGICTTSTFNEVACSRYGGSISTGVCQGLASNIASDISKVACITSGGTYTSSNSKKIELISVIAENLFCSGKRIDPSNTSPTPFSGGDGTVASPYKICKEFQLNSIEGNYLNSSFSLHADLDMNVTSVFGNGPLPRCAALDPGMNFIPIGGLFNASCTPVVSSMYTGTFNGNDHSISNIRLNSKMDSLGFVRSGGHIKNLTLKNAEVEGVNSVGAFSGNAAFELSNLKLLKGKIRGATYIGSIAGGYASSTEAKNLIAKNVVVQTDTVSSVVGGLIGITDNLTLLKLSKSSFDGVIKLQGDSSVAGGLVGRSLDAQVDQSFSSGNIISHGSSIVGGIVGSANTGLTISNSYSRINIGPLARQNGSGGNFGGLVGVWGGSSNISSSFYYGSIMMACKKGAINSCGVGAISGASIATTNQTYGAILYPEWFNNVPSDNISLSTFDSGAIKNNLLASVAYKDVGSKFPRLAWEDDTCAQLENNKSVSEQSLTRGSVLNPIILCNKEQFKEIKSYSTLNYLIQDNIGLGQVLAADAVESFSGSLDGAGFSLGGFYSVASSGAGGLFKGNFGTIKNTKFINSYLDNPSTNSSYVGVVGVNQTGGVIANNEFIGMAILNGKATFQGVVAGLNNGKILNNKISAMVDATTTTGLIAGNNNGPGVITGNRVEGSLSILTNANSASFGGAVGSNLGKISEVSTSVSIYNPVGGNSSSASTVGMLIGNSGPVSIVEDVLVEPYANLTIGSVGPVYGQVFGEVVNGASIKRVVATNDISVSSSLSGVNINSMTGNSEAKDQYKNSFILYGSTFKYSISTMSLSGCSSSSIYTYNLTVPFSTPAEYTNGLYIPTALLGGGVVSKRIVGNIPNSVTMFTLDPLSNDFFLPCGENGVKVTGTTYYYPIMSLPNFIDVNSEVHSVSPRALKTFNTYCPSSVGSSAGSTVNASCNGSLGEFDIVEDKAQGFGSSRLIAAYKKLLMTSEMPQDRPVWTLDPSNGYPQLFIAH